MDLQRLSRPRVTVPDDAEIWDLTSEEAGTAIETLAADTAREILSQLYHQPQTASELAAATDNSLQNVNYHLKNLVGADLIEVADTRYSSKGTEMKIYAPTTNAVLLLSQESMATRIKKLLAHLVGGVGALAIAAITFRSLIVGGLINVPGVEVETVAPTEEDDGPGDDGAAGADEGDTDDAAAEDAQDSTDQDGVNEEVYDVDLPAPETAVETINPIEHLPFLLDPGVVFFLGGLFLLLVFLGVSWWQGRY